MISVGRAGPADYGEPEKGGNTMFDRLKRDLGIRAILALILVTAFIGIVFLLLIKFGGMEISKDVMAVVMVFSNIVTQAIQSYFSNRQTLDKPQ